MSRHSRQDWTIRPTLTGVAGVHVYACGPVLDRRTCAAVMSGSVTSARSESLAQAGKAAWNFLTNP